VAKNLAKLSYLSSMTLTGTMVIYYYCIIGGGMMGYYTITGSI
jgi:hypothetical protein